VRVFRRSSANTAATGKSVTYHAGDKVACDKCGRRVLIASPPKDSKGKIVISRVDDMMPFAFHCWKCPFITCVTCALLAFEFHNPREGIPTCPSCGGPCSFFSQWLEMKANAPV
jgi:hypothetical protein